jgi:hypothetical protein
MQGCQDKHSIREALKGLLFKKSHSSKSESREQRFFFKKTKKMQKKLQTLKEYLFRHEGVLPELERARESNARFDDVNHLLKLSENERVTLMEHIEVIQEENLT